MRKKILVVDDDESTRFVLARALERLGCRVVVAEDGAEVPELISEQAFDLVVLDLYMPGMNGFEVLRQLRHPENGLLPSQATAVPVRVLVVSGETNPASVSHARAAGASDHLAKPVDVDQFVATVQRLLGMPAAG